MSTWKSFVCSNGDGIALTANGISFEKFKDGWTGGEYLPVEHIALPSAVVSALDAIFEKAKRYNKIKEALQ